MEIGLVGFPRSCLKAEKQSDRQQTAPKTACAVSWWDLFVRNASTAFCQPKLGLETCCLWGESFKGSPVCSGVSVYNRRSDSGCADPLDLLYHFNRAEMKERDYFPLFLCLSFALHPVDWPREMWTKSSQRVTWGGTAGASFSSLSVSLKHTHVHIYTHTTDTKTHQTSDDCYHWKHYVHPCTNLLLRLRDQIQCLHNVLEQCVRNESVI